MNNLVMKRNSKITGLSMKSVLPWLGMGIPLLVLAGLLVLPNSTDAIYPQVGSIEPSVLHLLVVGAATGLAAVVSLLITLASPTIRETRIVFLVLAFLTITGVLFAHALTTPGTRGHEENMATQASAALSLVGGALFIALSALPMPLRRRWSARTTSRVLVIGTVAAVIAYIVIADRRTDWFASWPGPLAQHAFVDWSPNAQLLATALALPAMLLFGFAFYRYMRAWRVAGQRSQWAMVNCLGLLMVTELGISFSAPWSLAWWWSHATVVASFAVLVAGLGFEWRRSGTVLLFSHALLLEDGLALARRGYGSAVRDLTAALEEKDPYTRGHTSRVAQYAYAGGEEVGLPELLLDRIALMGEIHDIGKIGIPDKVLLKPGSLTEREFEMIKTHTERGWMLTKDIPALSAAVYGVRHHHERLDGKGYPDRLSGEEIPLEVRCLSVGDVFDALTSSRPYRTAMNPEQALAILKDGVESAYDRRCIEALQALVNQGALDDWLVQAPGADATMTRTTRRRVA